MWDVSGPIIPDKWGYLRFRVFFSLQNLGRPGNQKIPDCLDFKDSTHLIPEEKF